MTGVGGGVIEVTRLSRLFACAHFHVHVFNVTLDIVLVGKGCGATLVFASIGQANTGVFLVFNNCSTWPSAPRRQPKTRLLELIAARLVQFRLALRVDLLVLVFDVNVMFEFILARKVL